MKIGTIFFDLGKTLVDFDYQLALRKIGERSSIGVIEVAERAYSNNQVTPYEEGRLTTEEFFRKQKEIFGFEGSVEELESIWQDIFTPMPDHVVLARQLAEYHPLACISNISETHIAFLEKNYDFFPIFRERFYSCRVGCMKPDRRIYEHALERMKADRFETLFIDDNEANILAASGMGWQTIHLRPDVSLKDALLSYDLRVV